jgi:hypothetical protein
MDLEEPITLSSDGHVVTLPLINLLRITMIKIMPLMLQFQQETGKSDLLSFQEWSKEKLGMKGKNVLL